MALLSEESVRTYSICSSPRAKFHYMDGRTGSSAHRMNSMELIQSALTPRREVAVFIYVQSTGSLEAHTCRSTTHFCLSRRSLPPQLYLGPALPFATLRGYSLADFELSPQMAQFIILNKFIILDSFEKCWAAREGSNVALASFGQSRSGRSRHFCRTAPLPRHRHLLALLLLYTLQASDQAQ